MDTVATEEPAAVAADTDVLAAKAILTTQAAAADTDAMGTAARVPRKTEDLEEEDV